MRFLLHLTAACALALPTSAALAQAWPAKPVRIIVPYPPGGGADQMGRLVASKLTTVLGQSVYVENQSGGNTMIGTGAAARAAADGYTLLVSGNVMPVNVLITKQPSYKVADFTPVSGIGSYPYVLDMNPAVPAHNINELLDYAKKNPGKLNAVSLGPGGVTHLLTERFAAAAGIRIVPIHYRGAAPAMLDLLSNQVQIFFDAANTALPQVRAGKLKPMAVTSESRFALLPEVPTLKETGLPTMSQLGWFAMFAPAGTPKAIVERLNAEVIKAVSNPDTDPRFRQQGLSPMPMAPEQFAAFVKQDGARWEATLRTLDVKLD
ncbi:MAG TPA: tripartite tricarboxylate transporter substrate binding protein [Burkholderiales bacterium]|jgi:tripartite-type tricarboxylate transporter receptor subunit TctC